MDFIDILHEEWLFCCTGAANAVQELPPQISQFVLPQDHNNYTVSTSSLYQQPEVEEWLLHLLVQTSRCLILSREQLQLVPVHLQEALLLDANCQLLCVLSREQLQLVPVHLQEALLLDANCQLLYPVHS